MPFEPPDALSFHLPPPPPPERRGTLRLILLASAVGHVVLFALFAGRHAEPPPQPPPRVTGTARVLAGEVTTSAAGETGLRLVGYRDVTLGEPSP
jgi:hypothetical protein